MGLKMDELTFRRRIYANPDDNEQDIIEACKQDPAKAKFKAEMQAFDKSIASALNVEAPDNLADRVLLSQTIDFQKAQKKKSRVHLALAASVAFAIGLTFQMVSFSPRHDSLAEHALAHVHAEANHLHEDDLYSQQDVNLKLASFGAEFTEQIAPIKFASFCRFGGVKSLHLVLEGDEYPVTVFIVPDDSGLKQSESFSDNEFKGDAIQMQNADMLIVTDKNDSLEKWRNKVQTAIRWKRT